MNRWLLDTGPLVAYLDAREVDHEFVKAAVDPFIGELATTSAVITEAMHFVSPLRDGPGRLAEFIGASRAEVYDFSRASDLSRATSLMEAYSDTPMDFADATLLLLADSLGVHDILTLDRRGFSTFRTQAGRSLRLVLDL